MVKTFVDLFKLLEAEALDKAHSRNVTLIIGFRVQFDFIDQELGNVFQGFFFDL